MMPDATVVEVRRRLSATPQQVFEAFAEKGLVGRWLSPSPLIALTVLQFEFRVGGIYRFAYHMPDGRTMKVGGVYKSIEPPSKIVFSWNIEPPDEHAGLLSEVFVSITPEGDGAGLLIRHENLSLSGSASRHAEGWRGAVDLLERELSDRTSEGERE